MPPGWQGERTRLVPLDRQRHFENALAWLNDPAATDGTLVGDLPVAALAEEEWFARCMKASVFESSEVTFAIETLDGVHIGFAGIHKIEWRHGVGETGTIIGPREFRGKGYGSDAVKLRTWYAFEILGLRMLTSFVLSNNPASRRVLEKAGYVPCGVVPRRYWKRGAYRDVTLLAVERDGWLADAGKGYRARNWREPPRPGAPAGSHGKVRSRRAAGRR